MLKIINKISDWLNKLCQVLVVVCIGVLIGVMFAQVLKRTLLGSAISWADGVARYMLIWTTFLGATVGVKNWSHISLTLVLDKLHGKAKKYYEAFLMLAFLVLAVVVVYAGIQVLQLVIPQKSDSLPISVAWIYAAIPFSYAVMVVHLLCNILNQVKDASREGKEGGEQ